MSSHVYEFGATGDGRTDDTEAIEHAIRDGEGSIIFNRGNFRVTRTLEVPLTETGRIGIDGSNGTAKLIMAGPGPAIRLVGTHGGTASPRSVKPEIWQRERMPQISNLEIEGAHPEADGIQLVGTMQAVIQGVGLHQLRHGIHLHERNRNVIISNCQVYHNTGIGIFLDRVNLHQINITGSHISYNRLGGIRIEGSEIRNLQITGNDIEYNNFKNFDAAKPNEPTAEIYIDSRGQPGDVPRPSVREFTIASNTIQATHSPNGANILIIGPDPSGKLPVGMAAISGNLIGNQAINLHLQHCSGIAITGNHIYGGYQHTLLLEDSREVTIGSNIIGHNNWTETRQIDNNISLRNCSDCVLSNLQLRGAPAGKTNWNETWHGRPPRVHRALLEIVKSKRINVSGCQFLDPNPTGIHLEDSHSVSVGGCQINDHRNPQLMKNSVIWRGVGTGNLMSNNIFSASLEVGSNVEVQQTGNLSA
ncbi:MAG: right-handed parallel beta-helix repeat-containing protein [Verrucomicrobiota bacterium]